MFFFVPRLFKSICYYFIIFFNNNSNVHKIAKNCLIFMNMFNKQTKATAEFYQIISCNQTNSSLKKKGALILRTLFQKNNLNNALEILNLKITCMRLHFHIFHVLWKTLLQFSTEVFIKALSVHIQREIGWWGGWVPWDCLHNFTI